MATHKIPTPRIFLRNKFSIKPGLTAQFFLGQQALLEHIEPNVELLAAASFGTDELFASAPPPPTPPDAMHIWLMPEWSTLYRLMWSFSESDWYVTEVSSLAVEHQDLLVEIGHGLPIERRPPDWHGRKEPGYIYVYQELRLNSLLTRLSYLRHLNWLIAQVREKGWHLQWLAGEITGTPSQVCLLWRVESEEHYRNTPYEIATGKETAQRYATMMLGLAHFHEVRMTPESTEDIDNRMPSRHPKKS